MSYRLAVLGGGVAGLSAAIHAALDGWEVELYEKGSIGGKAAQVHTAGYLLDPGPSIIILPEIYEAVFSRADRQVEDYLRFTRLDPITRVFFDSQSYDIPADLDEAADLVDSLDPHDGASFRDLMARLAKVAPFVEKSVFAHPIEHWAGMLDPNLIRTALPLWPNQPYKKVVERLFRHPLMRAFFYGFPSYSGAGYRKPSVAGFLIPYYMFAGGVYYPEGGVGAIPRALERLAQELGVTVHRNARVIGLQTEGKEIVAAELAGIKGEPRLIDTRRASPLAALFGALLRPAPRLTLADLFGLPQRFTMYYLYLEL
ncbi:MAG: hypothetical protein C4320_02785 [Armatimonadota bacterium]